MPDLGVSIDHWIARHTNCCCCTSTNKCHVCACVQAESEVSQLQTQLQDAVIQQEALHHALQDLQSTIAVLRQQIQQQAETQAYASDDRQLSTSQQKGSKAMQASTHASSACGLVQTLQQQVTDLRALSASLQNSQQQQHIAPLASLHSSGARNRSLRDMPGQCINAAGVHEDMIGNTRGVSASYADQKHDCMMSPPVRRSLPSRRLPMSAYASPASQSASHVTDAIKAHRSVRHSAADAATGDKCWCGRPKKLTGSTASTPSRCATDRVVERLGSAKHQHEGCIPSQTSTPSKVANRYKALVTSH